MILGGFYDFEVCRLYLFGYLDIFAGQVRDIDVFDGLVDEVCEYDVKLKLMIVDFATDAAYFHEVVFVDQLFLADHGLFASQLQLSGQMGEERFKAVLSVFVLVKLVLLWTDEMKIFEIV